MERARKKHMPNGKFGHVSEKRSKTMKAVRGTGNKTTERRLRFGLVRAGVSGWTLRPRHVLGSPDFFFPQTKLAIFVDGCFWHGCPRCGHFPKSNAGFWKAKIERNRERDRNTTCRLTAEGLTVLRFWEHELASDLETCIHQIRKELYAACPSSASPNGRTTRRLSRSTDVGSRS